MSLSEEVQELRLTLTRINESCFSAQCQLPGLKFERSDSTHKINVLESHIWAIESQAGAEDSIDQTEPCEKAEKQKRLEHLKLMFGSVNESIKKFSKQIKNADKARTYINTQIQKKEMDLNNLEA